MKSPESTRGRADAGQRERYPGPRSFADDPVDQRLFFGREREIASLKHRVRASRILLLFGKSGLGKTSLLQAGLFPAIREHAIFPVPIRFNQTDPPLGPNDVVDMIVEAVQAAAAEQGIDGEVGATRNLWEFFKTTDFWLGDTLLVPLLVLDQFEEVFTLQDTAFRQALAAELGELAARGLPASIRRRRDAGEHLPYSDAPPKLHVIISFREEYLASLEELVADVPAILEHRFRLLPLDLERARAAVERPAALEDGGTFRTQPFRYAESTLDTMLDFLGNRAGEVEPFQLQVLCGHVEHRIEERQAAGASETVVDDALLGGRAEMERVLDRFYVHALERVEGRRQRRRARRLCERGLLSPTGKRVSVEEGSLRRRYRLDTQTLAALIDTRLIRKDTRPGLEGFYYELSHDSLTRPVAHGLKRSRRRRTLMVAGGFVAMFALMGYAWWSERAQVQQIAQSVTSFRDPLPEGARAPEMLIIDPGSFRMGSRDRDADPNERPVREVTIARPFAISRHEVTFADFDRFCEARRSTYLDRLKQAKPGAVRDAARVGEKRLRERLTKEAEQDARQAPEKAQKPGPSAQDLLIWGKVMANIEAQRALDLRVEERVAAVVEPALKVYRGAFDQAVDDLLPELVTAPKAVERQIKAISDPDVRASVDALGQRLLGTLGPYPGCPGDEGWGRGQRPVINVSWKDANAYAAWLSEVTGSTYRLPTEAEWEYAARAGTGTAFWWGDRAEKNRANCVDCGGEWAGRQTAPVGSFAANPWGINDVVGNVMEWVQDCWHETYEGGPTDGSAWLEGYGTDCSQRVTRGTSWSGPLDGGRSAARSWGYDYVAAVGVGFRVARDLSTRGRN